MRRSKRLLSVLLAVTAVALAGTAVRAQLPEFMIWGAGSLLKSVIDGNQKTVEGAGKITGNIYIERGGEKIFVCGVDLSIPVTGFWGPNVYLEVIPVLNAGPPHDILLYDNNRMIARRKFEGGRVNYRTNEVFGNEGPVGGYPIIRLGDLGLGVHTLQVRFSKGEWVSTAAPITVVDYHQFWALWSDPEVLQELVGIGHSTTPQVQVLAAGMPDGTLRFFRTKEELEQVLKAPPPSSPTPPAFAAQSFLVVKAALYRRDDYKKMERETAYRQIAEAVERQAPIEGESIRITLPTGYGVGFLITSTEPFEARIEDPSGAVVGLRRSTTTIENRHILFVPVAAQENGRLDESILIFQTASGQRREVRFNLGG